MQTFYVTFGQKYRREAHPYLGMDPRLPDGWVEIKASDEVEARNIIARTIGPAYSGLYTAEDHERRYYPLGSLATLSLDEDARVVVSRG